MRTRLLLVISVISFSLGYFFLNTSVIPKQISILKSSIFSFLSRGDEATSLKNALNFTSAENPYKNLAYQLPSNLKVVEVDSTTQLEHEIHSANQLDGHVLLVLQNGIYTLKSTVNILKRNIIIKSKSGDPVDVIIQGSKRKNSGIGNLFRVSGDHFVLDGITLQNANNHLIQIAGEDNADYPVIRNCILQDSYQQLLKVSYNLNMAPQVSSDFGLIENCIFQYTEGIGPNFYIGGIDLHAGNSWIIRGNKFIDIASPGKHIAEHAIHVWTNAYNTIVKNNIIRDSDRGIGFGMRTQGHPALSYSHRGGLIINNVITHIDNDDPFADTGIILEDSPETQVLNNKIWLAHSYPRAIEYRFPSTRDVVIMGNITNKKISSRDGGKAEVSNNITNANLEDILIEME